MFGPGAIVIDELSQCWTWQGTCNYRVPQASFLGKPINVREEAFLRSGRTVPPGHRVTVTCGNDRCLNHAHLTTMPQSVTRPRRPYVLTTFARLVWGGRTLPPQPPTVSERNWMIVHRYLAGETLERIGHDCAISKERVRQIVKDTLLKLEPSQIDRVT
jgi:hypothetical protein